MRSPVTEKHLIPPIARDDQQCGTSGTELGKSEARAGTCLPSLTCWFDSNPRLPGIHTLGHP